MKHPKIIAIVFYLTFLSILNVAASEPLNIVIILDTSDRIFDEKHPGQIERDKEIIEEIVTEFEKVTKRHILAAEKLQYHDQLTIAIPNQPGVPPVPDRNTLDTLYEFVRQHKHTGSDIWEWFKYEAESYFSESHQNIIICISDGYLNFDNIIEDMRIPRTYMQVKKLRDDPQWQQKIRGSEGLLTIGQDFSRYNIDFLMSEIQLQTDENNVPY